MLTAHPPHSPSPACRCRQPTTTRNFQTQPPQAACSPAAFSFTRMLVSPASTNRARGGTSRSTASICGVQTDGKDTKLSCVSRSRLVEGMSGRLESTELCPDCRRISLLLRARCARLPCSSKHAQQRAESCEAQCANRAVEQQCHKQLLPHLLQPHAGSISKRLQVAACNNRRAKQPSRRTACHCVAWLAPGGSPCRKGNAAAGPTSDELKRVAGQGTGNSTAL